jgi:hypothetical protein
VAGAFDTARLSRLLVDELEKLQCFLTLRHILHLSSVWDFSPASDGRSLGVLTYTALIHFASQYRRPAEPEMRSVIFRSDSSKYLKFSSGFTHQSNSPFCRFPSNIRSVGLRRAMSIE